MNNIGEQLALIYLRINGFLPLSNFVIHRTDNNETGECDILALRLRNMKESIYFKDRPEVVASFDYSDDVFSHEILNLSKDIYLWVEVTLSNKVSKKYVENKFSNAKCNYVVERLGIQDWANTNNLSSNPFHINSTEDKIFAKVLLCVDIPKNKTNICLYTNCGYVKEQLNVWFAKYKKIKEPTWCAFIDPFLQGLVKQNIILC